jgi:hypothetical protein
VAHAPLAEPVEEDVPADEQAASVPAGQPPGLEGRHPAPACEVGGQGAVVREPAAESVEVGGAFGQEEFGVRE